MNVQIEHQGAPGEPKLYCIHEHAGVQSISEPASCDHSAVGRADLDISSTISLMGTYYLTWTLNRY